MISTREVVIDERERERLMISTRSDP